MINLVCDLMYECVSRIYVCNADIYIYIYIYIYTLLIMEIFFNCLIFV